jgi:hypothetical protein
MKGGYMPATEIATAAIAILVPYLAKAGDALAKKAGEAAWAKAAEIYGAIKARFEKESTKDSYPQQTLTRFEEQPELRKATMQAVLQELLQEDQQFTQTLAKLLKDAEGADVEAVFNIKVFGGKVGEIINAVTIGELTINKPDE